MNLFKTLSALRRLRARQKHKWGERGIAAAEFALTLPVWITILLGAADGTYYMLVCEKTDRIAYSVTDIVTQYQAITIANLKDILDAASQLMQPYPFSNVGLVIVSSVYKPKGQNAVIEWQYSGGGQLTQTSRIGTTGGVPTLPNGLTLNDNDNVIISEVYYKFKPMFVSTGLFPANLVYRVAIYKPRLSQLIKTPT
jgi:Flp pilus assembly protein TadG